MRKIRIPWHDHRKHDRSSDLEWAESSDTSGNNRNQLDLDFHKEFEQLGSKQQGTVEHWQDAAQDHIDSSGDEYYIGDAYRPINPICAEEWNLSQ